MYINKEQNMVKVIKIKELLAKDFKLGIDEFENQIDFSNNFYNEFLEIKGRFNQLEKAQNRGIIDHNSYNIEFNKLRVATIALLDKIQELQPSTKYEEQSLSKTVTESKKSNSTKSVKYFLIACSIGILGLIGYSIFSKNSSGTTREIKTVLSSYYNTLISKEFNSLGEFYADPIERYYDQKNIYLDDVIKDLKESKENVVKEKIDIDWKSLEIMKNDNLYHLEYLVDYHQKRQNRGWREYDLRMRMILDSNLKIKSIYEIKE